MSWPWPASSFDRPPSHSSDCPHWLLRRLWMPRAHPRANGRAGGPRPRNPYRYLSKRARCRPPVDIAPGALAPHCDNARRILTAQTAAGRIARADGPVGCAAISRRPAPGDPCLPPRGRTAWYRSGVGLAFPSAVRTHPARLRLPRQSGGRDAGPSLRIRTPRRCCPAGNAWSAGSTSSHRRFWPARTMPQTFSCSALASPLLA